MSMLPVNGKASK